MLTATIRPQQIATNVLKPDTRILKASTFNFFLPDERYPASLQPPPFSSTEHGRNMFCFVFVLYTHCILVLKLCCPLFTRPDKYMYASSRNRHRHVIASTF